jgi:hypothetical protein
VNLSRRSFLVSLSAAVAALTVKTLVPSANLDPVAILQGTYEPEQLIWTPDDAREIVLPARVARVADGSLINMTRNVLQLLEEELPGFRALVAPERACMGHTVLVREARPFAVIPSALDMVPDITMSVRTVMLDETRAYQVPCPSLDEWVREHRTYPDFEHAQLRRIAHDFARTIRRKRLNVFGEQDLPMGGEAARARSNRSGLAVRCVKWYDCESNRYILRFDILGGHA